MEKYRALRRALEMVQSNTKPVVKSCCIILSGREKVKVTRIGSRISRNESFKLTIGRLNYEESHRFKTDPLDRVLLHYQHHAPRKKTKTR